MSTCQSVEALQQFLEGTLSEHDTTALQAHLPWCDTCQSRLDTLSDVPSLRQWAAAYQSAGASSVGDERLVSQLQGLYRTSLPESAADEPAVDPCAVLRPFLGPPEKAGELGTMGSYRLQSHLGSGGMGIVFKAFDRTLKRTVAVKVLRPERAEGAPRARFVREAEATASLEDDHFVSVFAVANPPNAPPYFAMQYVDGPSLRDLIRQRQVLEARTAAAMALQIADGLAAAHRAGLIHRDIKPANILWDQAQGRARITDFGLVRAMANPDGQTQDGALPGTPEYMSPEQVFEPANVDERTDLYSLGVTLYEMLTGKVPFTGSPHTVLERVLHDEPLPPRRLNGQIPRDLETICLKTMARERTRRYQTAKEFRDDLRRWLDGQPIHARPVGVCERLLWWCWRNPTLAGLVSALVLVFAGGLGAGIWQWRRAEANADQARTLQDPAEARTLFEEKLAKEPWNSAWAANLARVLLTDSSANWTIIKPAQMNAEGGATLTRLDDGSILVEGKNPDRVVYSLVAKPDLKQINAIRLEALPDPSLPNGGPGRASDGNYNLSELRVFSRGQQVTLTNIIVVQDEAEEFRNVIADRFHAIRGWANAPRPGKPNTAIVATRLQRAADDDLRVEMYFSPAPEQAQPGLGRFRLSVSANSAIYTREKERLAAMKLTDPWAMLAAAYHVIGDQEALATLINNHPEAGSGVGDLYAACEDWERAISAYGKLLADRPADGDLCSKLVSAYQAAGRTREAIPHLAKASAAIPMDTAFSHDVAALQAWFGQDKEFAATRQRILAFAKDTKEAMTAERAAKVCSILPYTDKGELEAALALGRAVMKLGKVGDFGEWNPLALGMVEYRSGNDTAADRALLAAAEAGTKNRIVTGLAAYYRAMSLFRQGRKEEARELALATAVKMKPLPKDDNNPLDVGGPNDLILWLAYKEAKAMISFDATPSPKGKNEKK
jgi:tetratricopeptide (TPR) repeat protein